MLSFLPSFILAPFSFILFCINLAICGTLIFIGGLFKLIIPNLWFHRQLLNIMHAIFELWAFNNVLIINLVNQVDWQISGINGLNKNSWYLIIANHYSWLDIVVVAHLARTRIPMPKFFLKDSLKKMPFLGLACWALDMPFMKRYSRSFLEKHPELKGQDIETTRRSCQRFQLTPTTIVNYVEGTRCNAKKQQQQQSPYRYLLRPKAAGIAFTLAALENKFDKILNVTLIYPDNRENVTLDMLKGRLKRVIVQVEQIEVTEQLVGDYFNDEAFKLSFQQWLNGLWRKKDQLIHQTLTEEIPETERDSISALAK